MNDFARPVISNLLIPRWTLRTGRTRKPFPVCVLCAVVLVMKPSTGSNVEELGTGRTFTNRHSFEKLGDVPSVPGFQSSKMRGTVGLFSWIRNRLIRLHGAYLRVLSCRIESHWGAYLARLADQAPAKNSLQERNLKTARQGTYGPPQKSDQTANVVRKTCNETWMQ